MWVLNTMQLNHSIADNDVHISEMITITRTNFSGLLAIISLVFDLIASILATIFTFRFYKHIEISHPLYAVIFMDIVISTATSYLVSILFLVNTFVNSDIIAYLEYVFTAISVFNNVFSFMMVAFIRYYLLVYTKTTNEEEIDMIRVKNISLMIKCIIFIIILLVRGGMSLASYVGSDNMLGLRVSSLCLTTLPLGTTLILNRKIDIFLQTEHNERILNVNKPSKRPQEDQLSCSHTQSLGDIRVSNRKRERRNNTMPDIDSSSNCGIEKAGTSTTHSRYAWDVDTEAGTSTSNHNEREIQRYGGIYIGETRVNSHDATNMNENEVKSSTKYVNMLPNQLSIENENEIHIIEANVLSENKTESLHSNCKIEHQRNNNLCNSNIQNITMNADENKIEVLETIDDEATNAPSPNMIFPSDPEDNIANETILYSESREHKSIMKFVKVTSLLLFCSILSLSFISYIWGFKFITTTKIAVFMVIIILSKLCRTFLVIFSSIYCFELVRSLFLTITNEVVEFFQLAYDRFITSF